MIGENTFFVPSSMLIRLLSLHIDYIVNRNLNFICIVGSNNHKIPKYYLVRHAFYLHSLALFSTLIAAVLCDVYRQGPITL